MLYVLTFVLLFKVGDSVPLQSTVQGNEFSKYHDHDDLISFASKLRVGNENLVDFYKIGKSVNGKDLIVLKLSDNVSERTLSEPMFKYVANMHGDETVGRELLLMLAKYLVDGWHNNDPQIVTLLKNTEIHLMPSLNPDGFEIAQEGVCDGQMYTGRENAHNVDLNRNFPSQWRRLSSSEMASGREPETLAAMSWIVSNPFVLSGNLHGGSVVASYPFDDSVSHPSCCKYSAAPDDALLKHLAMLYSENHSYMHKGNVCAADSFKDGITNGADWYDVEGGMQDFNYAYSSCVEITFELSCCKYPPASELAGYWDSNKEALLRYIEAVHMGVKGIIRDYATQKGIMGASVSVKGNNNTVQSSSRGEYWRLLLPGNYTLVVHCVGYEPAERLVTVMNGTVSLADFDLTPTSDSGMGAPSNFLARGKNVDFEKSDLIKNAIEFTPEIPEEMDFKTKPDYKYHHYPELESFMKAVAQKYPNITHLYSVGKSVEQRELYVMEITDNPGIHEPGEPEFKYIGNMHGNEVISREVLIHLIQLLVEGYGTSERLSSLVRNTRIHIMPTMNPDGFEVSEEGDYMGVKGRANANGVDLNRNFPDQWELTRENKIQEPETVAVMKWVHSYPFVLSANLHGGSLVANYPWDNRPPGYTGRYSASPDDEVFKHLAKIYSFNHPEMKFGKVCGSPVVVFRDGITNGADWYSVSGGMQDYNYVHTNCFELTLEVACQKYPFAADLQKYWAENRESLLAFMEHVHSGVKGFITDENNNPVSNGTISVNGIKHDVQTAADGDYWRLLTPGEYIVTASASGHIPNRKHVSVQERAATVVNFTLETDSLRPWSQKNDFSIQDNLSPAYLTNPELNDTMAHIENGYKELVEFLANENDWSMKIHGLRFSSKERTVVEPVRVVILGGLFGAQSAGREVVIRLARHLAVGWSRNDTDIKKVLANMELYLLPALDVSGFEKVDSASGVCDNSSQVEMESELGSTFTPEISNMRALAFASMLDQVKPHVVLSLEGGGLFMRLPLDAPNSDELGTVRDNEMLHFMSAAFSDSHTGLREDGNRCHELSANAPVGTVHGKALGTYRNSLQDYVYRNLEETLMITAHISCCIFPRGDKLPQLWKENLMPLMKFLHAAHQAHPGASTKPVTDHQNGSLDLLNLNIKHQDATPVASASLAGEEPVRELPGGSTSQAADHSTEKSDQEDTKPGKKKNEIILDSSFLHQLGFIFPNTRFM